MEFYDIDKNLLTLSKKCEELLSDTFSKFDEICFYNSQKVLKAFQDNRVSVDDFREVTGYGYYDNGRDKLEKIYSDIFKAEDALVRTQIMSGTHALNLTFTGLLKHGDTLLFITGEPYDSLKSILGLSGDSRNSLIKNGVNIEVIDLIDNDFNEKLIIDRLLKSKVKVIEIQRSRGYSDRKSLTISKIEKIIKKIREIDKDVIIMVDNCYGDFVEKREPIEVGADILCGSLMKNLGGGVCKTGGYVVGKKEYVLDVAERLTAPGVGKDLGANLNQNLSFYKGLFVAPSAVCSSLKSMAFGACLLQKLGYKVSPEYTEERTDIIQTIQFHNLDELIGFCVGLQKGSPIDSFVVPIPDKTPGYPHEEIMAGGSFIEGSTIELSADAPCISPYTCFMQGGLTYEYGKLGILIALTDILNK